MTRAKAVQDPTLLEAALEGLEAQKQRIEEQIEQVRILLGGPARRGRPPGRAVIKQQASTHKRVLSPAARKRIAAAQKRRWAQFRKDNPPSAQ
jgi:hypothetical protein